MVDMSSYLPSFQNDLLIGTVFNTPTGDYIFTSINSPPSELVFFNKAFFTYKKLNSF